MTSPHRVTLPIYAGDTFQHFFRFTEDGGRVVFDGVTTSGNASITSVKAKWVPSDVGTQIFGTGITAGTTIQSVSGNTATLSASCNATATGGATFIIRSVDYSLYTFAAQMRANPRSPTILATFTCDTTNIAGGELLLTLDSATTADLRSTGSWDLQTTLGSVTETWLKGAVKVEPDTTRV